MQTYSTDILIRPRRQATFPKKILEKIDASVGDRLAVYVKGNNLILKTRKQRALDALAEIQRIIKESGVSEKEMQKNAVKIRRQMYAKRYAS